MKRLLLLLIVLFTLVGCDISNTPKSKVGAYLDNYTSLSEDVMKDLEIKLLNEDLNNENREKYKNVLMREYQNLKYYIKDESIDGDKATVLVKVTVYDLYKTEKETLDYMGSYSEEFIDSDGLFDNDLFNKYRLDQMLKQNDTVSYELNIDLKKVNDEWVVIDLDRDSLEKIHGLYNYEND